MPFNEQLHAELTAQGYTYIHHEAECIDDGDGESGPMPRFTPAYDEYVGATEYVYVCDDGLTHREARNLKLEKWFEQQGYLMGPRKGLF